MSPKIIIAETCGADLFEAETSENMYAHTKSGLKRESKLSKSEGTFSKMAKYLLRTSSECTDYRHIL